MIERTEKLGLIKPQLALGSCGHKIEIRGEAKKSGRDLVDCGIRVNSYYGTRFGDRSTLKL